MFPALKLVDINPEMVEAWRREFVDCPEVEIVQGSMTEQHVDAWVTPTNSLGCMDGGLDEVIKAELGPYIEQRVQQAIRANWKGRMWVGGAVCVPTKGRKPRYLISTTTMTDSSEQIRASLTVVWACGAAFQAATLQNRAEAASINSIALPGLGAATGRLPVAVVARLIHQTYLLFKAREFSTFAEMLEHLDQSVDSWVDS